MPQERTVVATLGTLVEAARARGHRLAGADRRRQHRRHARRAAVGRHDAPAPSSSARRAPARARPASPSACCARLPGAACARAAPSPGPTISTPASMPPPPACPASISTAGRCRPALLDALAGAGGRRCRHRRHRKRHGPVRRHSGRRRAAPARPPIWRGSTACRCCWCSTSPASRRRRPPSPRALPPTIRRCASPASCSTGSAASAIASLPATPSKRSACRSSAPSCATRR